MTDFIEKFRVEQLKLYESDYWVWSLRPVQVTLGSGILSLKRECTTLGELKKEEFADLADIIKVIEKTLRKSFNYDIMNYLMLMMVDKQVHYHVIPRYEKTINFEGHSWSDAGWPGVPDLSGESLEVVLLENIANKIRQNMTV